MAADLFAGLRVAGARTNAEGVTVISRPRGWAWHRREPKPPRPPRDQAGRWLRSAMLALGALAVTAAAVSYQAQYRLVVSYKHDAVIAGLQAAIPDVGALVFASLGIALALQGKGAVRPRVLNVLCVGISIAMNAIAASAGWRALAVWIMAPSLYALASDTLIGVVRAWTIARQRAMAETLAEDETTPLAIVGGVALWLLRLVLAPPSTLGGFRAWVVEEVKVAPGRTAVAKPAAAVPAIAMARMPQRPARPGTGTKTERFLALVIERHGPLAGVPVESVAQISAELAPEVDLHAGSARTALRAAVLAARNGNAS